MKISVIGHIIDTANIYQITPVFKINRITRVFTIKMFNNFDFEIKLSSRNIKEDLSVGLPSHHGTGASKEHWDKADKLIDIYIENVRNEVIQHWSESQSYITKIEFK